MSLHEILENEKNKLENIPNELLFKYILNSVDLEVMRETAFQSINSLRQKQADLIKQKKKLNDLHREIFLMNNNSCEEVWKFSRKHDFPSVIRSYLDGDMIIREIDTSRNGEFVRLENEFKTLSREIADIQCDLKKISETNNHENIKQESDDNLQYPKSDFKIPKVPRQQKNIPASKFSVKTPSAILKLRKIH